MTNSSEREELDMGRLTRLVFIAPLALIGITLFIAVGGLVVKLLWNWLLPPLFGWHTITFWQAIGLLALSRILFGGGGLRLSPRARMSSEARARFRQRMRERFGFGPPAPERQEL